MPRADRAIEKHKIPTDPNIKLVKQKLRTYWPELAAKVKEEIAKKIKAKFLEVVEYLE